MSLYKALVKQNIMKLNRITKHQGVSLFKIMFGSSSGLGSGSGYFDFKDSVSVWVKKKH